MKKNKKAIFGLLIAMIFSIGIIQSGQIQQKDQLYSNVKVQKAFWGLSKLMDEGSQEREVFTDVGLGVTLLFSAGGFVPGAIIGL